MPPCEADLIALGSLRGISASLALLSVSLTVVLGAADRIALGNFKGMPASLGPLSSAFRGAAATSVFSDFVVGGGTGTS